MRSQFGKIIRDSDVCVLCGLRQATTREHIPPQSLFITLPKQHLTVPACGECNASTKLDDEYLRQAMSSVSLVGAGIEMWKKKVFPKLQATPKTRAALRSKISVEKVKIPGKGEQPMFTFDIDATRAEVSLRKLVAGLYWFHTGRIFPAHAQLEIGFLNAAKLPDYFEKPENLALFKMTKPGIYRDPEVIETFVYHAGMSEEASLWYFFFYKQNAFLVTTIHGVEGDVQPILM